MKKLVIVMTLSLILFAEGYKEFAKEMAYETDYKTALERAKKEKKNLMVLMITNYCPWCSKFEKKTLMDKNVDDKIKSKYIPLIINRQEENFPKYLYAPVVPVTFFVEPNKEKITHESIGFSNKIDFLNLLNVLE
ncbi:thioredoxin family protein [Sulfurimonas sp.]|jgi:thioredoxin-related protein|uniref:thioredoxin family protein n=1 Tax=Sulfurimonas sp. TaxID=2022749 RepID=UPI0025EB266E|nr:thioredoxin family protein [Sulfurimonas sp.]MCK9472546.1 thioredoxin family protein [Sulfurimonas sp.]MDD3506699.1 thioredoxin family protein [Sulfurimonas sp.]